MSRDARAELWELYSREREYLLESGREFAERYPDLAPMLARQGADPSVERLLEGVAFLNATIRRRFDDEQVEVAQDLMAVLCPPALRPSPAVVIQQFTVPEGDASARFIPRGSEIASEPLPLGDGAQEPCRFTTCYPVEIPPLQVVEARMLPLGSASALRLSFRLARGLTAARLEKVPIRRLRLHLWGEGRLPADLMLFLLHRAAGPPRLRDLSTGVLVDEPLPHPVQVGFDPLECLLPGWERLPDGYRLLFEYFAFPEKFLFIELTGLEQLHRLGSATEFTIEIPFDEPFDEPRRVTAGAFRLGCTPAVNLFTHSAEPIRREAWESDYLVVPTGDLDRRQARPRKDRPAGRPRLRRFEVFDIVSVTGKLMGQDASRPYQPLVQVASAGEPVGSALTRWYTVRSRPDVANLSFDPWLILSPPEAPGRVEIVRVETRCTNGRLSGLLRPGQLCLPRAGVPSGVQSANLGAPSPSIAPPLGRRLAGRLVGQLSIGQSTLGSRQSLLRWLDLFNFRATEDMQARDVHRRRCEAIGEVRAVPVDRLVPVRDLPWGQDDPGPRPRFGNALARGVELRVPIRMSELGAGDAWLFGAVLDRVVASQAALGTFTRCVLLDPERRARSIEWPIRIGNRPLI